MADTIPTYTSEKAYRLIVAKKVQGEYHVTGWLYLSGAKNPDPNQWWQENGEATRRRCLAVCPDDGYALIQTDTDTFYAGCRKGLTREQALRHWDRQDARATLFRAAILANALVPA